MLVNVVFTIIFIKLLLKYFVDKYSHPGYVILKLSGCINSRLTYLSPRAEISYSS